MLCCNGKCPVLACVVPAESCDGVRSVILAWCSHDICVVVAVFYTAAAAAAAVC
jgi:hypothetical protein